MSITRVSKKEAFVGLAKHCVDKQTVLDMNESRLLNSYKYHETEHVNNGKLNYLSLNV